MFNIGPGELLAICAVALIVLGPQRLPQAVRQVGRVVGELRRISGGFQEELRRAIDDAEAEEDDEVQPSLHEPRPDEPEPMQMPTDLPSDLPTIEPFGAHADQQPAVPPPAVLPQETSDPEPPPPAPDASDATDNGDERAVS